MYEYGQLYTYIRDSPLNTRASTHWNLIGRSINAPPSVIAQQYSSATFVSPCFQSRKEKLSVRWKSAIFFYFKKYVHTKLRNLKLPMSGGGCLHIKIVSQLFYPHNIRVLSSSTHWRTGGGGYFKIGLDCLVPIFHLLITNHFLTISTTPLMSALNTLNTEHKNHWRSENESDFVANLKYL
jgi:hypothetical protein